MNTEVGPSSVPSYSVELKVYFLKTGGDFFLRKTYSNSEITWCTWTNIIINATHLIIKVSSLCLRYIHTAKAANCDQGFWNSDWSKLNFLLSHEINVV